MTNDYLNWLLKDKLGSSDREICNYTTLFAQLHEPSRFVVVKSTDMALMKKGLDLRYEYSVCKRYASPVSIAIVPSLGTCTFLEMLIALSFDAADRVEYPNAQSMVIGRISPRQFFWDFLTNLRLTQFTNEVYDMQGFEEIVDTVTQIVNNFEYGEYNPDGSNGGCVIIPCLNVKDAPIIVQGRLWAEYVYNKGIRPEDFYGYDNG